MSARAVAEPAESAKAKGSEMAEEASPYLTVVIAREPYAISVENITEVIEHVEITRVPRTAHWVLGILNLRGAVLPVVDLALKFGLPRTEVTRRTCIVMVELNVDDEHHAVGIMADAVDKVIELSARAIQPAPAFGSQVPAEYLLGLAMTGERLVPLLDVQKLLTERASSARAASLVSLS